VQREKEDFMKRVIVAAFVIAAALAMLIACSSNEGDESVERTGIVRIIGDSN
jgi:hypothetical protein